MNRSRCIASLVTVFVLALVGSLGASAEAEKPAPKKPVEASPPKAAPAKPDPFKVPDGTAGQLIAYVEGLNDLHPEKDDAAAVDAFNKKLLQAGLVAADKILAAKPDDRQAESAVQLKAQALFALRSLGQADAGKRLEALPSDLEKMGRPKLGRLVAHVLLANRVRELVRADLAELRSVVDQLNKLLGQKPEPDDLELVLATLEMADAIDRPYAVQCYTYFGKLLAASPNEALKSMGVKLQGAARRLGLIGHKMELEGVTLAGKPFKLDELHGKAVLVVFWATWCGPCRAEIPEIKQSYADYHQRGLEVVSISLDREREELEAFVKEEKIPWPVLFDADPKRHGFEHPMAVRYGVMAIPAMVLLDKQGQGVALDPRGPGLGEELVKIFGPPPAGLKPAATEGVTIPLPLPLLGKPQPTAK